MSNNDRVVLRNFFEDKLRDMSASLGASAAHSEVVEKAVAFLTPKSVLRRLDGLDPRAARDVYTAAVSATQRSGRINAQRGEMLRALSPGIEAYFNELPLGGFQRITENGFTNARERMRDAMNSALGRGDGSDSSRDSSANASVKRGGKTITWEVYSQLLEYYDGDKDRLEEQFRLHFQIIVMLSKEARKIHTAVTRKDRQRAEDAKIAYDFGDFGDAGKVLAFWQSFVGLTGQDAVDSAIAAIENLSESDRTLKRLMIRGGKMVEDFFSGEDEGHATRAMVFRVIGERVAPMFKIGAVAYAVSLAAICLLFVIWVGSMFALNVTAVWFSQFLIFVVAFTFFSVPLQVAAGIVDTTTGIFNSVFEFIGFERRLDPNDLNMFESHLNEFRLRLVSAVTATSLLYFYLWVLFLNEGDARGYLFTVFVLFFITLLVQTGLSLHFERESNFEPFIAFNRSGRNILVGAYAVVFLVGFVPAWLFRSSTSAPVTRVALNTAEVGRYTLGFGVFQIVLAVLLTIAGLGILASAYRAVVGDGKYSTVFGVGVAALILAGALSFSLDKTPPPPAKRQLDAWHEAGLDGPDVEFSATPASSGSSRSSSKRTKRPAYDRAARRRELRKKMSGK